MHSQRQKTQSCSFLHMAFEFVQIYLPITFIKETFSRYDAAKMLVCSYNESLRK